MSHDKKELLRNGAAALGMGTGIFIAMGWPFFRFCTYAGKKKSKSRKTYSKKWFQLKHTMVNHPRYHYAQEYENTRTWCEAQPMQDWYIRSVEGLRLHAHYLPAESAERFVVMVHGYRGSSFGSVASIAKFLHENHCNILIIDQRCCGESEGDYITYGAREQYDILEWLGRVSEENTESLPVYLYGQSMGATTVLLSAGHSLPAQVRGLIADCGFHSMKQQLRDIASGWFHLHWIELLLLRVDLFCRIFAGFAMKETDTTVALSKNKTPVLFFHGAEDTYVWPKNTMQNYELCEAPKELVIIPGARHLCCSYAAPQVYQEKIMEFMKKNDGTP